VLVVDDDALCLRTTVRQLEDAGYEVLGAAGAREALERLAAGAFDLVLCDLCMPDMDGMELLQLVRERYEGVDMLIMTAYGSVETAVEAIRKGAADYLTKPFHFEELQQRLHTISEIRRYRKELRELREAMQAGARDGGIIGRCPQVRDVVELVRTFAAHAAPVLVIGETGTGKELVARALHGLGSRSRGPFVAVGCGAIPETLAESELLGHERGAFTGAASRHAGAFERAHRGTLLLDDIDDLPAPVQAKLLRVLEQGTVARVGGSSEIDVDVRVVATTKVDLNDLVSDGGFRPDLYYRLRGLELRLPPLRERGDDVLLLAEHFLNERAVALGRDVSFVRPEAADTLRDYSWPGNVRELRYAMESAAVLCGGADIGRDHLPQHVRQGEEGLADDVVCLDLTGRTTVNLPDALRKVEQELIAWAMDKADGHQGRAAELLAVPRTTLQSKLKQG